LVLGCLVTPRYKLIPESEARFNFIEMEGYGKNTGPGNISINGI